jgi:hypothetical protein
MSSFLDDKEFADANYELNEVRKQLERSESLAPSLVEHAVISEWAKNGRWQPAPFYIKPGGNAFSSDLDHIIKTRKPDQIRVLIYEGGKKAKKPTVDKKISIKDPHAKNKETTFAGLEGALEEIKTTMKDADPNDLRFQLLRFEMQVENLKTKHEGEIREINMTNQFEIQRLQDRNQALETQLAEYENEDGELSGIEDKNKLLELVKDLAGGILSSAGENFIKKNPELLKGMGMSDETFQKFTSGAKQLEAHTPQTEASFSEAVPVSSVDLSGLDSKHKEGLQNLIEVFRELTFEKFNKICSVITALYDNDRKDIRENLVDKAMFYIIQLKRAELKTTTETKTEK